MSSAEPEVDLLTSIERGEAPRRILEFAARGFVPLPPSELVRAIATILSSDDAELGTIVEVECDTREQVARALDAGADAILLDNMSPREMTSCVALVRGAAIVEASGGITLESVRAVAEAGVDWISVGALTHSVPALDLALDFRPASATF